MLRIKNINAKPSSFESLWRPDVSSVLIRSLGKQMQTDEAANYSVQISRCKKTARSQIPAPSSPAEILMSPRKVSP